MSIIEKLDFGQDSAESEMQSLHYVFLSLPFYERLKNTKKWLVIGRKGSGKTAAALMLFRQLKTDYKVTLLTPKSISAAKSVLLDNASLTAEEAALQKWKYVFLLEISRYIVESAYEQLGSNYLSWPESVRKVRAFLVENDKAEANHLDKAIKFVRSINKFAISVLKVEGSIEVEKVSESGQALSDALDEFETIVQETFNHVSVKNLYFLVDQVDDLWDSTKEGQQLIVGLLRAAKETNDNLSILKIIVFLRSDIFGYLRFHDSDKYRSNMELITWDAQNLKKLIVLRIRKSTDIKGDVDKLWDSIFPSEIDEVDSFDYLVRHTLMRPRDLIQLCNICRDKARDRNGNSISSKDINESISRYSAWKLEDLTSEYKVQYPFLEQLLLSVFYYYRKYRLTRQEFDELFVLQKADLIKQYGKIYFEPTDVLLQILYLVGFLGVVHNETVLYESQGDKFILPYASLLEIHPAFRKGLNISSQKIMSQEGSYVSNISQSSVGGIAISGSVQGDIVTGDRNIVIRDDKGE